MRCRYLIFPLILFLLACPQLVGAESIFGRVVGVSDGDTVTILDNSKRQHKIRLYGIDCPESGQPFGKAAKQHTSKYTFRKTAEVKSYDKDRYGRTVGVVFVNGQNVNQSLIENGLAWQYRKYCKASFCDKWIKLEKQAQYSDVGLWADNDSIAPWQWRRGKRNSSYEKDGNIYSSSASEYHGNVNSHVFHSPQCRHFNCKNCTQIFQKREKAISMGFRPCGNCRP